MFDILTSLYTRRIFLAIFFICLFEVMHAQQPPPTDTAAVNHDSVYGDEMDSWLPDTVFNEVKGVAYPAEKFSTRHIPSIVIDSLKNNEAFWYADIAKKTRLQKTTKNKTDTGFFNKLLNQQWVKTIVWIIIILGFLSVLIWYLANNSISIFRTASKPVNLEGDHFAANIFEINYKREIEKALFAENYRLATRLMFLQLLKKLDEKNIIQYQQDFTNLDYRIQLQGTHYVPAFTDLVRFYEFTWYGKWQPGAKQFALIKEKFETFNGQLY